MNGWRRGACCLCLGLDYQPSANADVHELVYLSKIAKAYDAIYAAHIRYRILGRRQAWEETIEIAQRAEIPVHISHERVDDEGRRRAGTGRDRADRFDV